MARMAYVIETWRGSADDPIKLDEKGFPAEHWHEHKLDTSLVEAFEDLLGWDGSEFRRGNIDWSWNQERERIIPFPMPGGYGHLAYQIILKDTDGTEAVHLVLPYEMESDD